MSADAELVERCHAGESEALRAFVRKYQGNVFGLCYRMLGHREDAEDTCQEVFHRAFRSLHTWDSARPLKPWLLTIAANRCRTLLARRARRPAAQEFVENVAGPAYDANTLGLDEELELALQTLRDDYRTCFCLFHLEELSCAEIGEALDVPEGTVKTWLHRARRELAEFLRRRGVTPRAEHERLRT